MRKLLKKYRAKLIIINTVLGTIIFVYIFYFSNLTNLNKNNLWQIIADPYFYLSLLFAFTCSFWINKNMLKK